MNEFNKLLKAFRSQRVNKLFKRISKVDKNDAGLATQSYFLGRPIFKSQEWSETTSNGVFISRYFRDRKPVNRP